MDHPKILYLSIAESNFIWLTILGFWSAKNLTLPYKNANEASGQVREFKYLDQVQKQPKLFALSFAFFFKKYWGCCSTH